MRHINLPMKLQRHYGSSIGPDSGRSNNIRAASSRFLSAAAAALRISTVGVCIIFRASERAKLSNTASGLEISVQTIALPPVKNAMNFTSVEWVQVATATILVE